MGRLFAIASSRVTNARSVSLVQLVSQTITARLYTSMMTVKYGHSLPVYTAVTSVIIVIWKHRTTSALLCTRTRAHWPH